jgi:hypothetical protein
MIRRETGGKVRCEQALFVFGIKTEPIQRLPRRSSRPIPPVRLGARDSKARRAGKPRRTKDCFTTKHGKKHENRTKRGDLIANHSDFRKSRFELEDFGNADLHWLE